MKLGSIVGVVGLGLTASGCVGWGLPPIRDVRVEGVEVVRRADFGRCDEVGDLAVYSCPVDDSEREDPWVRVRFSTETNIIARADRYDMNTWVDADPCSSEEGSLFATGPFRDGVELGYLGESGRADRIYALTGGKPVGRHEYQIYLDPVRLRTVQASVCIVVGGGNMAGGMFRTRRIEITPDQLRDAFAEYDAASAGR